MVERIVSLIPSATEIVAELVGPSERLVAITHECDYPEWVRDVPQIVSPANAALLTAAPSVVDQQVSSIVGSGKSLYKLDVDLLEAIAPDVIVTQRLCDVCSVSGSEVERAIGSLSTYPNVIELNPIYLIDVLDDIITVGKGIGELEKARRWRRELELRLMAVPKQTVVMPLPKVLALGWSDPLWVGGHWVPEMISRAGGVPIGAEAGMPSTRISWERVRAADPDIILMMACGYDVERNLAQSAKLEELPGWTETPAYRNGRIYAVDANGYFSRPGPRLVDGTEMLSRLFRGEPFDEEVCRPMV
ncbi:corrinoid ABC transporter substrate-binding protein [Planctomycetes bacterium Pan216]|uniref:Corrinoid ABC transporter substrate-binding protein n=1 Tax=Kolteria novifilia TaxID=2527975 RepID=A0A518AYS7_9BACT|nr:corrinoid ABC transporter substrate-binding protein [Planctomycetes bacterium Pan216]